MPRDEGTDVEGDFLRSGHEIYRSPGLRVHISGMWSFSSTNTALETIATHHPVWCQSISASKTNAFLGTPLKWKARFIVPFVKGLSKPAPYNEILSKYHFLKALQFIKTKTNPPKIFMWTCQTKGKSCMKVPAGIMRCICTYLGLDDTVSASLRKASKKKPLLRHQSKLVPGQVPDRVSQRVRTKHRFSLPSAIPGCLSHSADKQFAKKGSKSSASFCSQASAYLRGSGSQ